MGYTVSVAGATGAVGIEMVRCLERRSFPCDKLRLFASARSAGKEIPFRGNMLLVEELRDDSFGGIDFVFSALDTDEARRFVPFAKDAGAITIDNSAAFRMADGVPLVVPEVNPEAAKGHSGIIANPNCSTIVMLVPVAAIHAVTRVKIVIVATYQAVSGLGKAATAELEEQASAWADGKQTPAVSVFPHTIAFNAIPHVGGFSGDGYTGEEVKMLQETRKILDDEDIRVSATCVRIPVFRAHSEAVFISTERPLSAEEARSILREAPGVRVVDEPARNSYPMPIDATEKDDILVGRIRVDTAMVNGIAMWVSGDQLLKGAALNAVQIGELLI